MCVWGRRYQCLGVRERTVDASTLQVVKALGSDWARLTGKVGLNDATVVTVSAYRRRNLAGQGVHTSDVCTTQRASSGARSRPIRYRAGHRASGGRDRPTTQYQSL